MSKNQIVKKFGLSSWSIGNKISVYVMIGIVAIIGLLSYTTMPKESFPEIKQPIIYINTPYIGNSPIDMENLVTRPIEKELNSINGVNKIESTSIQDFSVIIVEFDYDIPSEQCLTDVKDAVDRAQSELPKDLTADPTVFELDFSEMPVMNVNISGDYSTKDLKFYGEKIQDQIENLSEISEVDITGTNEEEVEIAVNRLKMEALEISFQDIENAIRGENVTMSGGDIKSIEGNDITRRNIRIDGEFENYDDLKNVIVKNEKQNIVYLRDIAMIRFGPKEPSSFARLDRNPVVTLDIKKKSGSNLINAAQKIQNIIAEAKATYLPKDLSVVITNDQSKFTKMMVNNLENSIIMGVILVVLVLIFFLGLRNSLFVGVAIPLSMLMGIAILNFGGNTMNMMVLFSLILALGMLVDNGIVVVENIYRQRELGKKPDEASNHGVGEVATAIIASTATTLAAFVPLLFWKSLMGEFMKFLPITLIIVLASSLFVALVVNPVLAADWMKVGQRKTSKIRPYFIKLLLAFVLGVLLKVAGEDLFAGLFFAGIIFSSLYRFMIAPGGDVFMSKIMPKIENKYAQLLKYAISSFRPFVFFAGTFVLFFVIMGYYNSNPPPFVFFPENEPQYVNAYIEAPLGTDIEKTNKITSALENRIIKKIKPYKDAGIIEAVLAQVGEKTSDPNEGPQSGSSPHKARITVSFIEFEKRALMGFNISTSQIMAEIKESCKDFPEANITFAKDNMGPPVGKPINVEVTGEDYLTLIEQVEVLKKKMELANIEGVDQLKTDLELGKPMLEIQVNREAARRYGLGTGQIASTIRTALLGKEISKYKLKEDDYEINLRLQEEYRYNLSNLMNTKVTFRNTMGKLVQVPISAVSKIKFNSTYGTVKRKDLEKVITIFSEVEEGYNANQIVAEFKTLLQDVQLAPGYTFKFTGEQEEQGESIAFLMSAMLLAVFLIFLIIVTQFNSFLGPFIIILSVVFSTMGVFLGFSITQMPFSAMMSGIGIISLAGIVVNNAIVLIDYTNLLRKRKRASLEIAANDHLPSIEIQNTIIEAGRTRLRPVLLTAITTILGLVPLAMGMNINFVSLLTKLDPEWYTGGSNAEFWGPMAWAVIFGLVFATFLTLIIVPVMYLLGDKLVLFLKQFGQKETTNN